PYLRITGRTLVLVPVERIFAPVPARDRKAEARPSDLQVRPPAFPYAFERRHDPRPSVDLPPAAVRRAADQHVAQDGPAETGDAAPTQPTLALPIPVQIAKFEDLTRQGAVRSGVTATLPLIAYPLEPGRGEHRRLLVP